VSGHVGAEPRRGLVAGVQEGVIDQLVVGDGSFRPAVERELGGGEVGRVVPEVPGLFGPVGSKCERVDAVVLAWP
jgi:hypothetical protein